ncbi:uncharacterized protein EI97DRAFT_431683 [Westerdykella ornata]|uniref:Letm1 RBD domain-containing protein n=1 Tax=Westerdykella ornata TaxID=318751 RepID=A0A6A6JQC4_WESOR|nr:uncharacterized protein EI97DRAFT_431683 [Westerdykella ornata]KAF2278465.1 hypothetical protein EI97DRAFT_431683 [Westerdykella ornata]
MKPRPTLLVVSTRFACAGKAPVLHSFASQYFLSHHEYRTIRHASSSTAATAAKKKKKTTNAAPIATAKPPAAKKKQQSAAAARPVKPTKAPTGSPPTAKVPTRTSESVRRPVYHHAAAAADHSSPLPPPPHQNPKLNPPPETYPAPIDVPARGPNQGFVNYIFNAGKAYLAFYKTGMKNLWAMRQLSKTLRERQRNAMNGVQAGETVPTADGDVSDIVLTRAEWQTVRRSRVDMMRACVFVPIFVVFGEWTPFLVPFLMPIVPETCRLPGQVGKMFTKGEARRMERQRVAARDRGVGRLFANGEVEAQLLLAGGGGLEPGVVEGMDKGTLLGLAARLDAYSGVWDYFMRPPLFWVRRALRKRLEYLRTDDGLIARDGGWRELGREELKRACWERGMYVVDKTEQDMALWMRQWFGGKSGEVKERRFEEKEARR